MDAFLLDVLPEIKRNGPKFDDLTLLTNIRWISIENNLKFKTIYIFKNNEDLLISTYGKVEKATWILHGNQSISIDKGGDRFLFTYSYLDQNILVLKIENSEEYLFFVNENMFDGQFNSINKIQIYLEHKFFENKRNYQYQKIIKDRRKKFFIERRKKDIVIRKINTLKYNKIWTELYLLCFAILLLIIFSYLFKFIIKTVLTQ